MDTTSWHSYPSIYAIGHRALAKLLTAPVLVEEKVDGSQFSFGRFDGELRARSKGATLNLLAPERMFAAGCEAIQGLPLHDGWTYRGEYLQKPKHNALAYDRVPKNHIILFDVNPGHEEYLSWEDKAAEAERLGLEVVPRMFEGMLTEVGALRDLLDRTSVLGGQRVEGVVVKSVSLYGADKKLLMGKFVSEAFKEVHATTWRNDNPTSSDVIDRLVSAHRTPARWAKAAQHLREAGVLEGAPKDIAALMKETQADVLRECRADIEAALWAWAWPLVSRRLTHGLPEWYKEELMRAQFEGLPDAR